MNAEVGAWLKVRILKTKQEGGPVSERAEAAQRGVSSGFMVPVSAALKSSSLSYFGRRGWLVGDGRGQGAPAARAALCHWRDVITNTCL